MVAGAVASPTAPGLPLARQGGAGVLTVIMITVIEQTPHLLAGLIAASTSGWLGDSRMLRVIRRGVGQVAPGGFRSSRAPLGGRYIGHPASWLANGTPLRSARISATSGWLELQ